MGNGQAAKRRMSESSRHTLATIFSSSGQHNILLSEIFVLLEEIGGWVESGEQQGCWLLVIPIGKRDFRVVVVDRHRGCASVEHVEELRDTFKLLGVTPRSQSLAV